MEEDQVIEDQISGEADQAIESLEADASGNPEVESAPAEKTVPLSVMLKERKKRQEAELNASWQQQQLMQLQQQQRPQEAIDDSSKYESATREDLGKAQADMMRAVEEKLWIKANPEKYEQLNESLPEFLKKRPNLAHAINNASNRYEEAFELMDKLSPKEQATLRAPAQKKSAPHSPASVPKSASLNAAVDVMSMSDEEYSKWRQSKKSRR